MNFLESAAVLVPLLSGVELAVYDGNIEVLYRFESQYCFSKAIQRIFTAMELREFLENGSDESIYEMIDPLGIHLIAFKIEEYWTLLGPFVEEEWDENSARYLLARLRVAESVLPLYKVYRCRLPVFPQNRSVKAAGLIIEHMDGSGIKRKVKTFHSDGEFHNSEPNFLRAYGDVHMINRRYHLEERFIKAVSSGETKKACGLLQELKESSPDLEFMSDNLKGQSALAAIVRTMARMGVKMAGLSPVLIDFISKEYAQRMQHASSAAELEYLLIRLIERFCSEVRKEQKSNYSIYVKKAIDYMELNFSSQITIAELSEAAGISQPHLVKMFGQETGMTMKQYLAKMRCDLAEELLQDSSLSVQEIGTYVGYVDNNYFSKIFKANKGVSPQDYRKKYWPPT